MIKLKIPAQLATPKPPIGPVLGQNQIPLDSFCKEFNAKTMTYKKGTELSVNVLKKNQKDFNILIKGPVIYNLCKSICFQLKNENYISLKSFYLVVKEYHNKNPNINMDITLESFFKVNYSCLLSTNIKIILDLKT